MHVFMLLLLRAGPISSTPDWCFYCFSCYHSLGCCLNSDQCCCPSPCESQLLTLDMLYKRSHIPIPTGYHHPHRHTHTHTHTHNKLHIAQLMHCASADACVFGPHLVIVACERTPAADPLAASAALRWSARVRGSLPRTASPGPIKATRPPSQGMLKAKTNLGGTAAGARGLGSNRRPTGCLGKLLAATTGGNMLGTHTLALRGKHNLSCSSLGGPTGTATWSPNSSCLRI